MSWNDQTIALLKALWAEGQSCSQISRALYQQTGAHFSRNAVIGKIHRLGLAGRVGPARSERPRSSTINLRPPSPPEPPTEPSPVTLEDGRRITAMTIRDGMCRWPIGDPAQPDFHFCGATCARSVTYCNYHMIKSRAPQSNPRRKGEPDELAEIARNARGLEAA